MVRPRLEGRKEERRGGSGWGGGERKGWRKEKEEARAEKQMLRE